MLLLMPVITARRVRIDKAYTAPEDVALYIYTYHELPKNYISYHSTETAVEHGVNISGRTIGGDTFFHRGGELSAYRIGSDATLQECDIRTDGYTHSNRGTHRLVYTTNQEDVRVFYTEDHYNSFNELTGFRMQLARNIFRILLAVYMACSVIITVVILCIKYGDRMKSYVTRLLRS